MDVERCVRTLNEAWPRGDWDTVSACFHPDVVMLLPDSDELLRLEWSEEVACTPT